MRQGGRHDSVGPDRDSRRPVHLMARSPDGNSIGLFRVRPIACRLTAPPCRPASAVRHGDAPTVLFQIVPVRSGGRPARHGPPPGRSAWRFRSARSIAISPILQASGRADRGRGGSRLRAAPGLSTCPPPDVLARRDRRPGGRRARLIAPGAGRAWRGRRRSADSRSAPCCPEAERRRGGRRSRSTPMAPRVDGRGAGTESTRSSGRGRAGAAGSPMTYRDADGRAHGAKIVRPLGLWFLGAKVWNPGRLVRAAAMNFRSVPPSPTGIARPGSTPCDSHVSVRRRGKTPGGLLPPGWRSGAVVLTPGGRHRPGICAANRRAGKPSSRSSEGRP